jgi:5'-nucleotidase
MHLSPKPVIGQSGVSNPQGLILQATGTAKLSDRWQPTQAGRTINIIYYNDIHGKPFKLAHYVTAFNTLAEQAKANGHSYLRLSGGDNNIGKSQLDWETELRLMGMMGLDSSAFGNHDSDMGIAKFVDGEQAVNPEFPILMSNIDMPASNELWQLEQVGDFGFQPRLFNLPNMKVGLIGVTTTDLETVKAASDQEMQGLNADTLAETRLVVQRQIDALKAAGAELVVIESHMGYQMESKLVAQLTGLDVLVGGHSHDELPDLTLKDPHNQYGKSARPNVILGADNKPVFIVQAGHAGKLVGQLQITLGSNGEVAVADNQLMAVRQFPRDPQAEALLAKTYGEPKVLGHNAQRLDNSNVPYEVNAFAQFMADIIRQDTGADIALHRSAEIRDDIEVGPIYDYQIPYIYPFPDNTVVISMTGADVRSALARAAKETLQAHDSHPSLLHYSGLKAVFDEGRGTVSNVQWLNPTTNTWEPLDDTRQYSVAVEGYATNGKQFPEYKRPMIKDTGKNRQAYLKEALARWDQQHPGQPINLKPDDRMVIIPANKNTPQPNTQPIAALPMKAYLA